MSFYFRLTGVLHHPSPRLRSTKFWNFEQVIQGGFCPLHTSFYPRHLSDNSVSLWEDQLGKVDTFDRVRAYLVTTRIKDLNTLVLET